MLQYLYFSSLEYFSVCQFVFELLCNITRHVIVMKQEINYFRHVPTLSTNSNRKHIADFGLKFEHSFYFSLLN